MVDGDPKHVANVQAGEILAGKYRVERVLGVGGVGVVVAAHHIGLDEKVAIKFLLPEMLANPSAVSRFEHEARAAVRIKGDHVARVFDVGTLETGAPYIVMEFLDGEDLANWLETRGALSVEEAVGFVLQACEAIAEAHTLGIVHRDLKPANLFCIRGADGELTIKVLDFGISKVARSSALPSNLVLTQTGTVVGSPFYMSPEQMVASSPVDGRTDIWSLGVILFELLTSRVPFCAASVQEVSLKIAMCAAPALREFRPDAPEGLEKVICRCLAKEPEARYANVAELALALLAFGPPRAKTSVEKTAAIVRAADPFAVGLSLDSRSRQDTSSDAVAAAGKTSFEAPERRRSRWGIVVGTVLTMTSLGAFAFVVPKWRSHPDDRQNTAAPSLSSLPDADGLSVQAPVPTLAIAPKATGISIPEVLPTTSASSGSKPPRPRPTGVGDPAPGSTSATSPRRPQPIRPECDPPYTFDDLGRKRFKHECFVNSK